MSSASTGLGAMRSAAFRRESSCGSASHSNFCTRSSFRRLCTSIPGDSLYLTPRNLLPDNLIPTMVNPELCSWSLSQDAGERTLSATEFEKCLIGSTAQSEGETKIEQTSHVGTEQLLPDLTSNPNHRSCASSDGTQCGLWALKSLAEELL